MNKKLGTIVALVVVGFALNHAYADSIPTWITNDAKWWSENQISDIEFVKSIQYLIQNDIVKIPISQNNGVEKSDQIPKWVKNNAGWWADNSISTSEFVSGIQYLVNAGIIQVSTKETSDVLSQNPANQTSANVDTSKCNNAATPADKETCISDMENEKEIESKIANSTPYTAGPVTYYLVGTDAINTGDGEMVIVHTVIENTGSLSKNPDLYCTGPFACNYHLSDGQGGYPPAIYSLTSGHLEVVYHKPVVIDWNFYSKEHVGGFDFDPSKQYYLKVDEPFGSVSIPLKLKLQ